MPSRPCGGRAFCYEIVSISANHLGHYRFGLHHGVGKRVRRNIICRGVRHPLCAVALVCHDADKEDEWDW